MAKKLPENTQQQSTAELVQDEPRHIGAALPDFIEAGDTSGTEDIGKEDLTMPRLAIAQGLSPQLVKTDPSFIPELRLGNMFNTLTGQVYGDGPLRFSVVRRDPPRWIEFDEDRNMVDPSVPPGDPRTLWRTGDEGERLPPIATQFYDFIIVLMDTGEPLALSCSRTAIAAAKRLNGLIKFRVPPIPIYAGAYEVSTGMESNDLGQYGVYAIRNAGIVKNAVDYQYVKGVFNSLKNTVINIQREAHDETVGGPGEQSSM